MEEGGRKGGKSSAVWERFQKPLLVLKRRKAGHKPRKVKTLGDGFSSRGSRTECRPAVTLSLVQ